MKYIVKSIQKIRDEIVIVISYKRNWLSRLFGAETWHEVKYAGNCTIWSVVSGKCPFVINILRDEFLYKIWRHNQLKEKGIL